jgi:hypothetical protein
MVMSTLSQMLTPALRATNRRSSDCNSQNKNLRDGDASMQSYCNIVCYPIVCYPVVCLYCVLSKCALLQYYRLSCCVCIVNGPNVCATLWCTSVHYLFSRGKYCVQVAGALIIASHLDLPVHLPSCLPAYTTLFDCVFVCLLACLYQYLGRIL